jgi:aryl-alcohol dehydrogenase-like predicted oxidoreductase
MRYNQFGATGLVVSRMTLGAMTFGDYDFSGFKSNVGETAAREMVMRALEAGVNFFDTADMYAAGQSEQILGRALGPRRHDVVLATKAFFRTAPDVIHGGLSRRHLIDACEASLRRLGTDYIDLYLLHNWDPITPLEETARALDDLQCAGKVRYVGQSNFGAWQAERLIAIQRDLGFAPIVAAQVYYSLLGRDIEHEVVPQAQQAGLGIMAWGPLAGGFLTGKYTRQDTSGGGSRRASFDFPPIDVEKGHEVVEKMTEIASAHEASTAQVALAWILAKPFVHTVLVGASRLSQLESNLKAVSLELAADEVKALDGLTAPQKPYPQWIHWGEPVAQQAITEGWRPEPPVQ